MENSKRIFLTIIGVTLLSFILLGIVVYNYFNSEKAITASGVEEVDFSSYTEKTLDAEGAKTSITSGGVYTISDQTIEGYIYINTTENVKIILNNVTITNTSGPAIYVENVDNLYIELQGENTINANGSEELHAAIYSKDDVKILGDGTLNITSDLDGIFVNNDLEIESGTITITSGDDGIVGDDSILITGGTITVSSAGDSIKSDGIITIESGTLDLTSEDDGIHADGMIEINNGKINIKALEGIEATYVKINGGTITISASDDGINATNKSTDYSVKVEINGGDLTINMGQGDTDGIDSNGDLTITGGTINVTGQSAFDYDGTLTHTGGTLIINGEETNEITNQFGGGMNNMGRGGQMPNDGNTPPSDGNDPTQNGDTPPEKPSDDNKQGRRTDNQRQNKKEA